MRLEEDLFNMSFITIIIIINIHRMKFVDENNFFSVKSHFN